MKRFGKAAALAGAVYLTAAMAARPQVCVSAAQEAVRLCLEVVIPALFPFFVCSRLLTALGADRFLSRRLSPLMEPLFGVPGSGALAVLLGIFSGYPVGAACAADLYAAGACTKTQAERLLAFCSNSGPMFVLGAVGVGMLGSQRLGLILYGGHVAAALAVGVLFRGYGRRRQTAKSPACLPPPPGAAAPAEAVGTAVAAAVETILKVCGFVTLFAVVAATLPALPGRPLAYALLEITGGLRALLAMEGLGAWRLPVAAAFLAFSGISVLMQTAGIVLPKGLSLRPYLLGKLTQGLLAFLFTLVLLCIFPPETPASALFLPPQPLPSPKMLALGALASLGWCALSIALLCLLCRKRK